MNSMQSLLPILSSFFFVIIHSLVDMYAVFRFEPTHFLSLGISKLLKDCDLNMLSAPDRKLYRYSHHNNKNVEQTNQKIGLKPFQFVFDKHRKKITQTWSPLKLLEDVPCGSYYRFTFGKLIDRDTTNV